MHGGQALQELENSGMLRGADDGEMEYDEEGSMSESEEYDDESEGAGPLSPSRAPGEDTKDKAIPHAMSIEAWHRSQQNEPLGSSLPSDQASIEKEKAVRERMDSAFGSDSPVRLLSDSPSVTTTAESRISQLLRQLNQANLSAEKVSRPRFVS